MSRNTLPKSFYYFGFGSNLYSERIRLANPSALFKSVGYIPDYKLEFGHISERWRGAAANIIPSPGDKVFGVVWELSKEDHSSLDHQEGVHDHIYERLDILVNLLNEPGHPQLPCIAYQLTQTARNRSLALASEGQAVLRPSKIYKSIMLKGAREHGLPQEYIDFLEALPDNGYDGPVELTTSLHKLRG